MPITLYELSDDLHRLQVALDEMELSPEEQAAALDAYLEGADDLKRKLDGYACLMREYETTAAGRKAEADRLAGMAASDLNRVKALKERLRWFFEAHELDKVSTERFKFTLANNGGLTPLQLPENAITLQPEYQNATVSCPSTVFLAALAALRKAGQEELCLALSRSASYSANTEAIREALTEGRDVPGACYLPRGKHMLVR